MKAIYFGPLSAVGHADDVLDLIEDYCQRGQISVGDDVASTELAERLIHAAANQFGLVIELTLAAMEQAYLNGDASLRGALLHKWVDGRSSPIPGQTYPTACVKGMPSAVKPFRTATRTWNSAT